MFDFKQINMIMKTTKLLCFLLMIGGMATFMSCGSDDPIPELTITAIVAEGTDLQSGTAVSIDLNGANAAEEVPLDAVIKATFSADVDPATATSANIQLLVGTTEVTSTVSVSGAVVTLTPATDLERGTSYSLSVSAAVTGTDGNAFTAASRTFMSAGRNVIAPPAGANQLAHFLFDGNSESVSGTYDSDFETGVVYVEDRFGNVNSAALFDGNTSLIEVPNGNNLLGEKFTVSYWAKVDTLDHANANGDGNAGHFVMGVGGGAGFYIETNGSANTFAFNAHYTKVDGTTGGNGMFVNADGKNRDNGGWIGIEFENDLGSDGLKSLFAQKWAHIVMTYDGSVNKRSLYVNGVLMETDDLEMPTGTLDFNGLTFNADAETGVVFGSKLAFGFAFDRETTKWNTTGFGDYTSTTSNHFKGCLDDVRFFDTAFSLTDVTELYNAEK